MSRPDAPIALITGANKGIGPSGVLWGHLWTTEGGGDGGHGVLP